MKHLSMLLLGCFWLCLSVATMAQDTRVMSYQNLGTNRTGSFYSTVPSDETHSDIRTGNLVTDATDPLHPCHGNDTVGTQPDKAGSYSVFTQIIHPGGEIFISTLGSNFDTVVSIFNYADAGIPLGAALACNDDQTMGSVFTSFIDVNLPAGRYLVMVSRFSETSIGTALNLDLEIGYLPGGLPPVNDNPANAIALTTHQAYTQSNVQFATDGLLEQGLSMSCEIYNSVWYTYTAPVEGEYQFTSFGSVLQTAPGSNYELTTAIGVYTVLNSGTQASDYILEGCVIANQFNAVTAPLPLSQGETYHIRLGTYSNRNLLSGTKYKIKPVVTAASLLTNERFNDGLTGWKTTKFEVGDGESGGRVTMNAGTVKKTVSQTKTTFPKAIKWVKGGVLHFNAGYNYTGTPSGKFTVTVAYSDGKPNTVVNIPFSTSHGYYVSTYIPLASPKVKSVKVMATANPGSGWSVSVNFMVLTYLRDPSATRAVSQDILPFPVVK